MTRVPASVIANSIQLLLAPQPSRERELFLYVHLSVVVPLLGSRVFGLLESSELWHKAALKVILLEEFSNSEGQITFVKHQDSLEEKYEKIELNNVG
jgi:hypothetical protein